MEYNEQQELRDLHKLHKQVGTRGVLISLRDLKEVREQVIFNLNLTQ